MTNADQPGQNPVDEQPLQQEGAEHQAVDADTVAQDSNQQQEATQESESVDLAAKVTALQEQVDTLKDQALRSQAEAQNARRRAQKDVESAHKYALDKFAQDLLPVIDNLERAIQVADKENEQLKSFLEGVELTRKSLVDAISKHGLSQLDPHGEPFDPQYHQAMTMIEKPDAEPNTVVEVMQRGYTLNGRLLRPAMVVVSKAAPSVDMKA